MEHTDITFDFENRPINARPGDSIAKALFDNGIRTLSYSVKYKRPRGIHCARGRCVMCHMEVDGVPGVPTCITPALDGIRVRRENFRPFFAPLLIAAVRRIPFPAGFYYRMFTKPAFVREMFLGTLRRMAGVGRLRGSSTAAQQKPSTKTQTLNLPKQEYDTIVVGAGLSGMSAALDAAGRNASVLLVDEYAQPGGHSIGFQGDDELASVRDELTSKISRHRAIHYLPGTTALAFYPPATLLLGPGGAVSPSTVVSPTLTALHRVRAASFVFATGAYDAVPLFENNDTPGVFGSRALRLLIERDRLRPGSRAAVYGTGPELAALERYLTHHGIEVTAVIDGTRSRVTRATGRGWVSAVTIAPRDKSGRTRKTPCDMLAIAFCGQPAYELAYQAGFKFEMSGGDVAETRVMIPTNSTIQNDDGVTFRVVGELAGKTVWREKVGEKYAKGNPLPLRGHRDR